MAANLKELMDLSELMLLAEEYACEHGFLVSGHPDASKYAAQESRLGLLRAIENILKDADRYRFLRDSHPADDYLWVAMGKPGSPAGVACWREEKLDAAIDARNGGSHG